MHFHSTLLLLVAMMFNPACGQDKITAPRIESPYARATVPGQSSGAVYLTIENKATVSDQLVAISTPIAKSAEIHSMAMDGNVMKMREVSAITLTPSSTLAMKPGGGYHLMLTGLHKPLKSGDYFPLTLTFEKAGKMEVSVAVREKDSQAKR